MLGGDDGKCLVLGGRGFIGSHLADRLSALGIKTRVLARRPPADSRGADPIERPNIEVVFGDFNNEIDLLNALDGCNSCVHLISTTLPKTSNENMIYDVQTNLVGTVRLLHYAQRIGMKRVVFVSSGGTVYGDARYLPIDEHHPTEPKSSYGITKLAAEKYMAMFNALGVSTVTLRFANPFGPRQRTTINQGAVAVFLSRALSGQVIEIWGDGNIVRDYLYVGDGVEAIIKALQYEGKESLFNIGSGQGRSLNDVISAIEAATGKAPKVRYLPGRSLDADKNVLAIDRARAELEWTPSTSFHDGLRAAADWYRSRIF